MSVSIIIFLYKELESWFIPSTSISTRWEIQQKRSQSNYAIYFCYLMLQKLGFVLKGKKCNIRESVKTHKEICKQSTMFVKYVIVERIYNISDIEWNFILALPFDCRNCARKITEKLHTKFQFLCQVMKKKLHAPDCTHNCNLILRGDLISFNKNINLTLFTVFWLRADDFQSIQYFSSMNILESLQEKNVNTYIAPYNRSLENVTGSKYRPYYQALYTSRQYFYDNTLKFNRLRNVLILM